MGPAGLGHWVIVSMKCTRRDVMAKRLGEINSIAKSYLNHREGGNATKEIEKKLLALLLSVLQA